VRRIKVYSKNYPISVIVSVPPRKTNPLCRSSTTRLIRPIAYIKLQDEVRADRFIILVDIGRLRHI